jgi:hypothetical protein
VKKLQNPHEAKLIAKLDFGVISEG